MQLEALAEQLAKSHTISSRPEEKKYLLDRLQNQEKLLRQAYQHFIQISEASAAISYAGEWILDNYYIIQQAIRQIREDMPRRYYRQLPKLGASPMEGYPRVFALAWKFIDQADYHINLAELTRFVQAYQRVTPLKMGEIWALPIMLRMGIIQALTEVVTRAVNMRDEQQTHSREGSASETSVNLLIDESDIANCVQSLRTLDAQDWKDFFEGLSQVEHILRSDPAEVYARMDFESRDRYRDIVEELAQASGAKEQTVAEEAIWLAEQAKDQGNPDGESSPRAYHVGFYLLDEGRDLLEKRLDLFPSLGVRLKRWLLGRPTLFYLGSTGLIALLTLAAIIYYVFSVGGSLVVTILTGLLFAIPALSVAVEAVNSLVTHTVPSRRLPRLDYQDGIPPHHRAMVVIPCLATDRKEIASLLHQLELHYISNMDSHLYFALLTDFADASEEERPEDERLRQYLKAGIEDLNRRYDRQAPGPFYLFHRKRKWNPAEETWMGWERKRGKLEEFNRLLGGDEQTSYQLQLGDLEILPEIKYVITVDADTVLPRGSARQLVATLAHPLNQAVFDDESGEIEAGYTVLQPRVETKPTSVNQTLFTQIYAGEVALDLYTRAVSDVYHDLFGEGNYTGKGIYDVAAFRRSLEGRVPENALLSHDLFEGLHGRVGLVTDVILLEDYPAHYLSHAKRWHRWVRGDWQLLPWLKARVPVAGGDQKPSRFSTLDRWKIIDNLRRSLVRPVILACLLISWFWLPGSTLVWTLLTVLAFVIPLSIRSIPETAQGLIQSFFTGQPQIRRGAFRWLLELTFLPYQASITLDAIVTTFVRLMITRKRLLQWTTAAHTLRIFGSELKVGVLWKRMFGSSVFALFVAALLGWVKASALPAALPFLLAWLLAPQIAYWISLPVVHEPKPISEKQHQEMRCLARRTWLYYETFVGPDDHWLPPDHFQEDPRGLVAHRTSPTNIGLLLLSTLAAYDLGYIGLMVLVVRLVNTLEHMERLERYRGHFLNWYDTRSLEQLDPPYVSTVDSGNLAGCLLALKQGCLALPGEPVLRWQRLEGLLDTLIILEKTIDELSNEEPTEQLKRLKTCLAKMCEKIKNVEEEPSEWPVLIDHLADEDWNEFEGLLIAWLDSDQTGMDAESLHELRVWEERTKGQIKQIQREFSALIPWLKAMSQPPPLFAQNDLDDDIIRAWETLQASLTESLSLEQLPAVYRQCRSTLGQLIETLEDQEALKWAKHLSNDLRSAHKSAQSLLIGAQGLSNHAEELFKAMDFSFLYNPQRKVFSLGYNVALEQIDGGHYDLLASEARLASLIAIARGDVPPGHWLQLARPITRADGSQAFISWNGSMFEYLLPPLLLRRYPGTALSETHQTVVQKQIDYGRQKKVPWGISEAGYYAFDANMNYQYQGFGVPGLGFKRGLGDDLVIAPYASMLAIAIQPQAVLENYAELERLDMVGLYGLYESIDFTEAHLSLGDEYGIVRSYYAHHHGMILTALTNYLQDEIMVSRFHTDPRITSVELLLQGQIPREAPVETPHPEEAGVLPPTEPRQVISSWQVQSKTPIPQAHCLSNGELSTVITNTGSGYSRWKDTALTRWRPDATLDDWGTWIYLQDQENGHLWSAGFQPVGNHPESEEVLFFPHQVKYQRREEDISVHMEVAIAPRDNVEIRRLTLINHSDRRRSLRLTSYGEVVLAPQSVDQRHPAYNKLFIESEHLPDLNALLFRRRPRSNQERPLFLIHLFVSKEAIDADCEVETRRDRFIGRGGSVRAPKALTSPAGLSGFVGAPLDPVMAIACPLALESRAIGGGSPFSLSKSEPKAEVAYLTLAADSRDEALALARRYQNWHRIEEAFDKARYSSEKEINQLNLSPHQLQRFDQILSGLLYPASALRADADTLRANRQGQQGLWPLAISGDYPILLVRIDHQEDIGLVNELLQAHAYWRNRNLKIDLVILNLKDTGYSEELSERIRQLLNRRDEDRWLNSRGGIFIVRADQIQKSQRVLLETAARVILDADRGSLVDQLQRLGEQPRRLPSFTATASPPEDESVPPLQRPEDLLFDNGLGGFSPDGREYVLYLEPGEHTPQPWINVIANPAFGFTLSESGSGYTWAVNSGENRLTPWTNDPVSDTPGEAIYLREEEVGHFWSPTPAPAGEEAPYLIRHGIGYSTFEHHSHGLKQRVRFFAAPDDPVKIVQVQLENTWSRTRRVNATYFAEWVLGTSRSAMSPFIIPDFDTNAQTLLARNPYNAEFGERTAFLTATRTVHGLTTDRTEFLGRMGDYCCPEALKRVGLAAELEPGLDPCAAIQVLLWLAPGETKEVTFILGQGADRDDALRLAQQYRQFETVKSAWQALNRRWDRILNTITVNTPDEGMNLVLNRWLPYQALACRVWGRSALYQSSGAFGFRDQLQDVTALVDLAPDVAREHILESAGHQFEEGDVLHWWHPPSGRGVRTRCSDDLLWLPFVTAQYVRATGDEAILDEVIPFLEGELLREDEEERYGHYESGGEEGTLFEHCKRAIAKGTTAGKHNLPLMGSHDWNDGYNRVGNEGKGESVWLGWFLYEVFERFGDICLLKDEREQAEQYRQQAKDLAKAIEEHAWDGAWYRRAYYDDGTPMGSAQNEECQIDSLAQSWALLSGAADSSRAEEAMDSVRERLIKQNDRLILLFTPPFDKTDNDPGYIRGYLPGIRENGGQYTHAALWAVWAFTKLGQGDLAGELFRLLNPVYHTDSAERVQRYQVEPYVVAADVYSNPAHTGHGGWTWYTGSSGWMYRLGMEAILGLRRRGDRLEINPCIPSDWEGYDITYRYGESGYHLQVENPNGVSAGIKAVILDGREQSENAIPLEDDGEEHHVQIVLGAVSRR